MIVYSVVETSISEFGFRIRINFYFPTTYSSLTNVYLKERFRLKHQRG